jgi:O-antigen/teichoic acid export membrane protein
VDLRGLRASPPSWVSSATGRTADHYIAAPGREPTPGAERGSTPMSDPVVDSPAPIRDLDASGETVLAGPARPVSLRVSFYWMLAGHVVGAGCKWLELSLLAKLGTRHMVGQFAYALALTAPVVMLTNLQLRAVQATDARGQFPFRTYLGVRLAGNALALAVIGGLAALAVRDGTPGALGIVLAMGVAKVIEAAGDVFHGLLQRHERLDVIARSLIAKGVLSVAAMIVALRVTGSVLWAVAGLAVAHAAVLAAYDVPQSRALWARRVGGWGRLFELGPMLRLIRVALPLGVVMMLASLGSNVPRYFVEHRLGVGELGVFSAVSYIMVAGLAVIGALGHAAIPRLSRHYAAGDRSAFLRVMLLLVALALALGAGGVAVAVVGGRRVLSLLYRSDYAYAQPVLVWTMIGATAAYLGTAFDYCLTAARSLPAQAPLWAAMLAATAAGCALLVPRYALVGAAMAVALGYAVQCIGAGWLLSRALRRGVSS